MIKNLTLKNKHFHNILDDQNVIDQFRAKKGIPDHHDIVIGFYFDPHNPSILVFNYDDNEVEEYSWVKHNDWKQKTKFDGLINSKPIIQLIPKLFFTPNIEFDMNGRINFSLDTHEGVSIKIAHDGSDLVIYGPSSNLGYYRSSVAFDNENLIPFYIELFQILKFDHSFKPNHRSAEVRFIKSGFSFQIVYIEPKGYQYSHREHSAKILSQAIRGEEKIFFDSVFPLDDIDVSAPYIDKYLTILQQCYSANYHEAVLSNLKNNVRFLEWAI